jgi:uncharacterized protein DUF669
VRNKPGSDLLPDGEYDATIVAGEDDKRSQAGNEMMELVLAVYDREGKDTPITDYIVATPKMQWKIRHLCEAVGVEYERDTIPVEDFVGANVRVKVVTQDDAKYGPQNRIQDYLKSNGGTPKADRDADIPF